jgi:hypothetical protein
MTMKRVLVLMMLVLLACGSSDDTPTAAPPRLGSDAPKQSLETLVDRFEWGDESQPARDRDADAAECTKQIQEDPRVRRGAHPLVHVAVFVECMQKLGWLYKNGTER